MKGLLVVNEFLNTTKFFEHAVWLKGAAEKLGIQLTVKTNAECLVVLSETEKKEEKEYEFVLFWDKDIRLAKYFELCGYQVFNCADAIADCDDKGKTHLILMSHNILMPKTILAPMTYENIGYTNLDFLDRVELELKYPLVVKECFGSFGAQVYLAHDRNNLVDTIKKINGKPMLFQEFIKESEGRDVRLQVVGDRVVAAMYRYSVQGDFRANITNGGHMKPYQPSKEECELAVQCTKLLNLSFGGVDLLFGAQGKKLVCEVNSNAHFKNIYDCTGVDTAKEILLYIQEQLKSGRNE